MRTIISSAFLFLLSVQPQFAIQLAAQSACQMAFAQSGSADPDPFQLLKRGDSQSLSEALLKNPKLSEQTRDGQRTLLMEAALYGDAKIVGLIIKQNPTSLNKLDSTYHSALYLAVKNSQEKAALLLIEKQAVLQFRYDTPKDNILHVAARVGNIAVVEALLQKMPILINETNELGETPLFEAVKGGQTKAVKVLLRAGADKNIKNKKGKTILDLIDPKIDKKMWRIFRTHET